MRPIIGITFFWIFLSIANNSLLASNSESKLEVMRVFVPEDQLRSVATREHIPVDIPQLEEALLRLQAQTRKALADRTYLKHATYVARLEDGVLVSDNSLWELAGPGPQINLGQISVALKRARVDFDQRQLLDGVRYTPNGLLEAEVDPQDPKKWFGFSLKQADDAYNTFAFRLPVAVHAQMLIATPPSVTLTSDEVMVEAVSDPTRLLPADWPNPSILNVSVGLDWQWWLVHLSAVERFSLKFRDAPAPDQGEYRHVCTTGRTTYWIGPDGMEVSAKFDLRPTKRLPSFKVRISKELQIREVLVDGQPADWTPLSSLSADSSLIEINPVVVDSESKSMPNEQEVEPDAEGANRSSATSLNQLAPRITSANLGESSISYGDSSGADTIRVELRGVQAGRLESGRLPAMAIAEAFVQRGTTRVLSFGGQVVEDLKAAAASVRSIPIEDLALDGPQFSLVDLSQFAWLVEWAGESPDIELTLMREKSNLVARGMTSFIVNPDWLTATCRIQLRQQITDSNSLRLRIAKEWFVDSVRLIDENDDDAQVELTETSAEDQSQAEVVISWLNRRNAIDYELEVVAHRPLGEVREQIGRVVTASTEDQLDYVVLQTTGRYQISVDPRFLRYQRTRYELPAWQQELLPNEGQLWIFQFPKAVGPTIELVARKGSFTAKLIAWPEYLASGRSYELKSLRYTFQLQSEGGAIENVQIRLPPGISADDCRWNYFSNDGPENAVARQLSTDDAGTLLEINADSRDANDLLLGCVIDPVGFGSQQALNLPIPQLENAANWNTTIILPSDLGFVQPSGEEIGESVVELLPVDTTSRNVELLKAADLLETDLNENQGLVIARLDSAPLTLKLRLTEDDLIRGWIEEETVSHFLDGRNRLSHELRWSFSAVDEGQFLFRLPPGWQPSVCQVNGQTSDVQPTDSPGEYRLTIPSRQRSDIFLRCTSDTPPLKWLQRTRLFQPRLSYPVLVSNHSITLPATWVAIDLAAKTSPQQSFLQLLSPRSWWVWLSPAAEPRLGSGENLDKQWTTRELERGSVFSADPMEVGTHSTTVILAERAALVGLAIATCIFACSCFYLLIGFSIFRVGLLLILLAVSVVLTPLPFTPLAQVLLLAAVLASGLRLAVYATARRVLHDTSQSRVASSIASGLPSAGLFLASCILLSEFSCGRIYAQSPELNSASNSSTISRSGGDDSTETNETYGVLLPVDSDRKISGSYAYVPQRLYDLLFSGGLDDQGAGSARILDAAYTLRVNPTTATEGGLVQELSAVFTILMPRRNQQLSLPIRMDQMPLSRSEVNGRQNTFGTSVRQSLLSPDALTFSAVEAGEYRLNLYFSPTALLKLDGAAQLQVAIPPIPSATLRVFHDANTRVEVNSKGSIRRLGNQLQVALGGVAEINCRWFSRPSSIVVGSPVNATSHVSLEARGTFLSAVSVLEVENPFALPETFRVVIDENWQAIGSDWGDAEVISTGRSTLSGRRVYSARWKSQLNRGLRKAVIRTALAPRFSTARTASFDGNSLENTAGISLAPSTRQVPFLILQEAQQIVDRTLTWDSGTDSEWQTDARTRWIALGRPSDQQLEDRWGAYKPQDDARSYRAPAGVTGATISGIPVETASSVSEITQIHLSEAEARISYSAQWLPSRLESKPLVFLIPADSRVESVMVDGVECEFQLTSHDDTTLLLVRTPENRPDVQRAELELVYPTSLGKNKTLQRIVAKDTQAKSSVVRVLRASGLRCDLRPQPTESLIFDSVSARPTEMLENLERLVGQAELGNQFRDSSELPVSFALSLAQLPDRVDAVLFVQRIQQDWSALLKVRVIGDGQPDFLFFNLPRSLRDELEVGQVPLRFIPSADADRITLAVMPLPGGEQQTEFEMRLPIRTASAGKQLIIPKIQVLLSESVIPTLALPAKVAGENARWKTGREPVPSRLANRLRSLDDVQSGYQLFEGSRRASQVTWETDSELQPMPAILLAQTTVKDCTPKSVVVYFDFWVDPLGNTELQFEVPESLKIVGGTVGDQTARIRKPSPLSMSILLEPNYAPLRLQVLAIWDSTDSSDLPFIKPKAAFDPLLLKTETSAISTSLLHAISEAEESGEHVFLVEVESQADSIEMSDRLGAMRSNTLADLWYQLVRRSLDALKGQPSSQVVGWLKGWHPSVLGITLETPLSNRDVLGVGAGGESTVGEAWQAFCDEMEIDVAVSTANLSLSVVENLEAANEDTASTLNIVAADALHRSSKPREVISPRLIALTLLVAFSGLVLMSLRFIDRQIWDELFNRPWIPWLGLTWLSWFVSPVLWPTIILGLLTLLVLSGGAVDRNRQLRLR